MSMLETQSIVTTLVEIIANSPGQRVLGARLGALLKSSVPDFAPANFQCRGLRQFLRTYASSEIEEKGSSGPDLIYGLANSLKPQQGSFPVPTTSATFVPPPVSAYYWRAFTNPSYPYILAVNRETGAFQSVPLGVQPSEPWASLPKPTPEDHVEIARAFLSTIEGLKRAKLEPLLSNPRWYMSFSSSAKPLGVSSLWGSFRTTQLRSRFEEALKEAGVSHKVPPVQRATPALATTTLPPQSPKFDRAVAPADTAHETRLRELVISLIAEMPLRDLREVRLPVGEVFDFLLKK